MSERIKTRASMSNPVRAAAVRASERASPAGAARSWRHGMPDSGPRLTAEQQAVTSRAIRDALLRGKWSEAIETILCARGERWSDMGLDLSVSDSAPLSEIEADYVVAVAETHLARTDLAWCAWSLVWLSRVGGELARMAAERAKAIDKHEARSMPERKRQDARYYKTKAKGVA